MIKTNKTTAGLVIGALGIVFGDIGTSPLYVLQALFGPLGLHLPITSATVEGIISLIFWAITLVVAVKYLGFVMGADNEGEGGIMALVALVKSSHLRLQRTGSLVVLGIIGVTLFYGDSIITPAISVLSALEGLHVVAPQLSHAILPITLAILVFLFWVQQYGTGAIGHIFGPLMAAWFLAIGGAGLYRVLQHPGVLLALSPVTAVHFFLASPKLAFLAMGAVVLAITGAEALYADMGHFGRGAIARAWFYLVFPALTLCYLGQGALLLHNPASVTSPLFLLFPPVARSFMVGLATLATLIASQAVISGAFSLTRQAVQLDFLPRLRILHTSVRESGQVYLPFVNGVLFSLVVLLVLIFRSSVNLAGAYGLAVSITLAIDSILYLVVTRARRPALVPWMLLAGSLFVTLDLLFVSSSLTKVVRGGWFPLLVGTAMFVIIKTWLAGQRIITAERKALEGSLQDFTDQLRRRDIRVARVPGQAVFIGHHDHYAPLALHAAVDTFHELPEKVVVVSVHIASAAHVPEQQRAAFDALKYRDGISYLQLTYGFHDHINLPHTLQGLRRLSPELNFDPLKASYFVSRSKIVATNRRNLAGWRKSLYTSMQRNAFDTSDYYHLPPEHTVELQAFLKL